MAIHVHLETMVPPQHLGGAADIDGGLQHHLPAADVGQELLGVVGELDAAEAGGEAEQLAGARRLGAGLDGGGAEERAGVVD